MISALVSGLSIHFVCFFFFKQKTAYEMRISDWSSDVCSSDLPGMGIKFNHVDLERVEEVFHRRVVMAAAGAAHRRRGLHRSQLARRRTEGFRSVRLCPADRKSTRLNSSH